MMVLAAQYLRRLLSCLAAALCVCLPGASAHGQALPTATGPGSYVNVGVTGAWFNVNYGQRWVGGGSIYVDANLYRHYGAEVEYQTFRYNQQAGIRQTTYLAGPRVSFRTRGLVPYADILVGRGDFDFPYGYAKGTYFVYAPGGGLDYDLTSKIKLRLINVQYQKWPQFTFGDLHPYGASAGISLRVW
jgi:opacity protein-like surface antigen